LIVVRPKPPVSTQIPLPTPNRNPASAPTCSSTRAAVRQQLVEQDTGELARLNLSRDQILARFWEIANMDPEKTRNTASAQVKALSLIVAIEGLISDRHLARHALSAAQNQPAPLPAKPPFYNAAWLGKQQGENVDPEPPTTQQEAVPEPQSAPGPADGPAAVSSPALEPTPTPMELSSPRPKVEGPGAAAKCSGNPLMRSQFTKTAKEGRILLNFANMGGTTLRRRTWKGRAPVK
jgi:hypothetical protein